MATLYKHGEIGQIEKLAHKLAYCADGQVLKNDGFGWKVWKKIKAGLDPKQVYTNAVQKYQIKLNTLPVFADWRKTFHDLVPFNHRALVLNTISLMPNDPDGVYSELEDYQLHFLSIDDCVQLCHLYRAAELEAKQANQQAPAPA